MTTDDVEEGPGAVVVGTAGVEAEVVPGAAAEVLVVPEAESEPELEEPPFKQLLSAGIPVHGYGMSEWPK